MTAGGAVAAFIPPMAAVAVTRLPEGEHWLYEVKLDGYRALLIKNGTHVQIRSRHDKDLTAAYPGIVAAGRRVQADNAVIDGAVVALDRDGRPSFQALQHRADPTHTVQSYAFDLLHLAGQNLTRRRLDERRGLLPTLLTGSGLRLSEALGGSAAQIVEAVRSVGLEGVVAKRRDSAYDAGMRSGAWVKLRIDAQQEFVVGGYRPGAHGIDALLVGVYEGTQLRFAGKVRTGFTPRTRREVFDAAQVLHAGVCPFVNLPSARASRWGGGVTVAQMGEMQWLRPALVAQIRFVEWTADQQLRHAAFLGLRHDKDPASIVRENLGASGQLVTADGARRSSDTTSARL